MNVVEINVFPYVQVETKTGSQKKTPCGNQHL